MKILRFENIKLNLFGKKKNESLAIEERQNEYSTLHYTEWNPRESLIIPNRIGLLRG